MSAKRISRRRENDPANWPVVWRVVAPDCGSTGDMVMEETTDETEARRACTMLRRAGWPVRMERVQQQPLPKSAAPALAQLQEHRDRANGIPAPTQH